MKRKHTCAHTIPRKIATDPGTVAHTYTPYAQEDLWFQYSMGNLARCCLRIK